MTVFVLIIVARGSFTGAAENKNVTIAYSSISGNMAPLWIAHERGFFREYGLETQLILAEGGSRAAQMLVSGGVLFAQMAGPGAIEAALRGKDVVMIAGVVNTLTFQLMVQKGITQADQLKGKALAVTRYGSSTDFATRYVLDKYGLSPDRDVVIFQLGTMPALFAALEAGKIHGALLSAPFTSQASNAGFHCLADLRTLGLEYQHTGIATTRMLIKSQPELVRNFMKAYVVGIRYYKTHREQSVAILQKYLKVTGIDALSEIYEDIGLTLVPERPYPTVKGIHTILQELGAKDPVAATARPEQFVDSRFVQELDHSGFIDHLYKSSPLPLSGKEPPSAISENVSATPPAGEKTTAATKPSTPAEEKTKLLDRPVSVSADESPVTEEYTIRAGDTLMKLAEMFYGSRSEWGKIYRANRRTISNPNELSIGQKIAIPRGEDRPGR